MSMWRSSPLSSTSSAVPLPEFEVSAIAILDPGIAYQLDQGHAGTPALEPEHTRQGRIGEGDAIVRVGYQDPFRDAV